MATPKTLERGLSVDVFLRKVDSTNDLVMSVYGHPDKTRIPQADLTDTPQAVAVAIQTTINRWSFNEPVREVFFHNDLASPLPKETYAPVRDYLKKAQKDSSIPHKIEIQGYRPEVNGV